MLRRRVGLIVFLILLSGMSSGCDFLYGLLQRAGAEEKALLGECLPYTPNDKVKEVQELLNVYGYKIGKPDGVFGQQTRDAIEEFQRQYQLKPTRFVDNQTWEQLNFLREVELINNGELNLKTVQKILKEAGFDPGKSDGKKGLKTIEAIKNFQSANELKPDGVIGVMTMRKLIDFLPAQ